jgi:hypothetical protein
MGLQGNNPIPHAIACMNRSALAPVIRLRLAYFLMIFDGREYIVNAGDRATHDFLSLYSAAKDAALPLIPESKTAPPSQGARDSSFISRF